MTQQLKYKKLVRFLLSCYVLLILYIISSSVITNSDGPPADYVGITKTSIVFFFTTQVSVMSLLFYHLKSFGHKWTTKNLELSLLGWNWLMLLFYVTSMLPMTLSTDHPLSTMFGILLHVVFPITYLYIYLINQEEHLTHTLKECILWTLSYPLCYYIFSLSRFLYSDAFLYQLLNFASPFSFFTSPTLIHLFNIFVFLSLLFFLIIFSSVFYHYGFKQETHLLNSFFPSSFIIGTSFTLSKIPSFLYNSSFLVIETTPIIFWTFIILHQ